jgi:hypothetical protein
MAAGLKSSFKGARLVIFIFLCFSSSLAGAQDLLGLRLNEVFESFGVPDKVYAVRGNEAWQDDVVFIYEKTKTNLYIYKDRVWQAELPALDGIKTGDRKAAVLLALSGNAVDEIEDSGGYILCRSSKSVWPRLTRYNFDAAGRLSAIFIYREDN